MEQRKKMEALLTETQLNLDNEHKIRNQRMNNNQHHNDKIVTLEKQLKKIEQNYKNETETTQKHKKHAAELGLAQQELESKISALHAALQQEVTELQTILAQKKNARSQLKEAQKETENKMQSLLNDLERAITREQQAHEDNRVLSETVSDLEKANASLDLELFFKKKSNFDPTKNSF